MAKYYGAAAEYNKTNGVGFNRRIAIFAMLGLALLVLMTAVFMVINAINSGPRNDLTALVLRTQRMQQFVAANQEKIKNGDLAKVNSDASLLFTSDSTALRKQLTTLYGKLEEFPPDISRAETDTTSEKKLEKAALINQFDREYITILRDKIAATVRLAQKVSTETDAAALRATIKTALSNAQTIDSQLAAFKL